MLEPVTTAARRKESLQRLQPLLIVAARVAAVLATRAIAAIVAKSFVDYLSLV